MEPRVYLVFLILFVIAHVNSLPYDVHWLSGATTIERDIQPSKQTVDIYCYTGTPKNLFALWQTVKFNIKIKNDEFSQYLGDDPEQVYKDYKEDSYGWAVINPFQKKSYRTVSLDLFTATCMAVNTREKHKIELNVQRVDLWRVLTMVLGLSLIFSSRALCGNPVFFYLCGIVVGVSASFMVLVYYVSKLLPKKTLTYGILIGGWTVGVYLFQQVWENVSSIVSTYQTYLVWYTLLMGFISFVVCYRIGPPQNQRSKNLVMWTLQIVGTLVTFFSSQYQEASAAIIIAALTAKYFPQSLLLALKGYWHRRFPPKPRLLTSEEYFEQGARETKHALDSLRKYCSSPDCAQWNIMLKLSDAKRFIEGNSHLSDDEVMDYESYAFSMERSKPIANSTRNHLEISDDDSSECDD
ncbi:nuclear envelope integral membrane protein 1 isoform X2 [Maniola jurtina]|uniref:nuclear envelope integral membrane protein 1 isoform X2 n=1 Tax=Maniola jurtina TaxID=191418 RepID=UPI001E68ED5F|nr:nuclear envelope integral membrane protein 1 isoform X2 [Maniola jurtina]